jgi:hypothetical protein
MPVKFNYGGHTTIKSLPGSFVTFILFIVLMAFMGERAEMLI